MRDARTKIAGGVDGVPSWSAERHTDGNHQQRDRKRAQGGESPTSRMAAESDDDEHEHKGGDAFGEQVPAVAADCRSGGEDTELGGRIGFDVEVLLVGEPREHRTEERSDELCGDVDERRDDGDRNARAEFGGAACD